MTVETGISIPSQPAPKEDYTIMRNNVHAAALAIKNGESIFWDNGPVFAWPGDAGDPYLQDKIMGIKSERGAKQPLGYTVPYSHSLDLIDKNRVGGKDVQELLDDPDGLTACSASLTFIRAAANLKRKAERNIPDSIIPSDAEDPHVQLYSSNGNDVTHLLVRAAMALGVEPVMTSANPSGVPEFVYAHQAHKFADEVGVKVFVNWEDDEKPPRPRGSYPILGVAGNEDVAEGENGRFLLLREGCFGIDILRRALDGYEIVEAPDMKASKYPDHIMTMQDITQIAAENPDFRELPHLRGPEFRLGLLAVMEWQFHHWDIHRDKDQRVIHL